MEKEDDQDDVVVEAALKTKERLAKFTKTLDMALQSKKELIPFLSMAVLQSIWEKFKKVADFSNKQMSDSNY